MLSDKEKNAAVDLMTVSHNLTSDELQDEDTKLFNNNLGDFLTFALKREIGKTEAEVKRSAKERRQMKKEMTALLKSFKAQLDRAIDEVF